MENETTKPAPKEKLYKVRLWQTATEEIVATSREEVEAILFEADLSTFDWETTEMTIEGGEDD